MKPDKGISWKRKTTSTNYQFLLDSMLVFFRGNIPYISTRWFHSLIFTPLYILLFSHPQDMQSGTKFMNQWSFSGVNIKSPPTNYLQIILLVATQTFFLFSPIPGGKMILFFDLRIYFPNGLGWNRELVIFAKPCNPMCCGLSDQPMRCGNPSFGRSKVGCEGRMVPFFGHQKWWKIGD